jgi:uncharacterized protein YkwD
MKAPFRFRLLGMIALGAILFLTCSDGVGGPIKDRSPAEEERNILNLVNDYRRSIGRGDLVWNEAVAAEAREHSLDMAGGRTGFGHEGFKKRIARIGEVLPYSKIAENVAYADRATAIVAGWAGSGEHRTNIEGEYSVTGVGAAWDESGTRLYVTQIYVLPRED